MVGKKKGRVAVKLYSTLTCPYCYMAKDYLKAKGVKFEDIDVSSNHAAAEEMIKNLDSPACLR